MHGFRRPMLRPDAVWHQIVDGIEFVYLDGERFVEFEVDAERRQPLYDFVELLADADRAGEALEPAFPGSGEELRQMLAVLDEQGMLVEGWCRPAGGVTGLAAYAVLRRAADEARERVRSPLFEALREGTATRTHLIGYAIEYWHVTHLCPRALAPVLARDDVGAGTWRKLMAFYLAERNHDRMLEKSLAAVGVTREQLLRSQPLPAVMALMAALGVYAYDFPLALIATLFPMEEPEPDFLELFVARCGELGMPEAFVRPIIDHSDVNEDESHDAVTLDLLADVAYVGDEELHECVKAVADVIEQRARLDREIVAWYGTGGVRDFTGDDYPVPAGQALTCAPLSFLA